MIQNTQISDFKATLEGISGDEISEQEAHEAFSNLAGFFEVLIEIDKSLKTKNKGNENVDNRNTNLIS